MIEIILLCSNALIMGGMFIITLYRARIEKRAIDLQVRNAVAREKIRYLKRALEKERDIIVGMTGEEFIEFLETICNGDKT